MEARSLRLIILFIGALACAAPAPAASYRTANFFVTARDRNHAKQIGDAAETYRRELAMEWLDRELPRWPQPCPIEADVDPRKGASGATSFSFHNRQPRGWEMDVQGSFERIMDSVLPHEVTHTIFATHFGGPLPRWADEGACTTVEHPSERQKQEGWLIRFIQEQRGIPFNQMFAMTEYPRDILPLYAQGYSVTRYLIAQGGKQKFVAFVGDGIATNNWNAAVKEHYGYDRLGDLQVDWQEWLGRGQSIADVQGPSNKDIILASATQPMSATDLSNNGPVEKRGVEPIIEQVAVKDPEGWYSRQVNAVASPLRSARQIQSQQRTPRRNYGAGERRSIASVVPPSEPRSNGSQQPALKHDDSGWTSLSLRSEKKNSLFR